MKRIAYLLVVSLLIGCGGGGGGGGDATNGSTPIVTTLASTSISPTSAILNGTVIPNGLQTQWWFEYGTDSALATYTTSLKLDAGSGLTSQAANMTWNGLSAGTTYYFRFCAENSKGSSKGDIVSFPTSSPGSPPTVTTFPATSLGATGATLNGNVTPNGLVTTAWFEWGTDPSMTIYSNTTSQVLGSGVISQVTSIPLIGLSTGTTYYYRVVASNSSGTTKGSTILSFTPGAAPAVTTLAATPVAATTATLNGNATANGLATDAWFEWGTDSGLSGASSTSPQAVGSGTTSVPVNTTLTGLATGTTYYYRVVASNSSGTTKGSTILSFTPGAAPAVTTLAATSVAATTATLNGNVIPNGLATSAWFEYGTNPNLVSSTSTSSQSVGSGTTSQSVSAPLTGLSTGTTYYYRVVASNSSGTTIGSILSFVPGAAPAVTTGAATPIDLINVALNGTVNPNGLATTYWFEWGTSSTLATYDITSSKSAGSGTEDIAASNSIIPDMMQAEDYYYRLVATNSSGTTKGEIVILPTSSPGNPPPAVQTLAADNLSVTEATLHASVIPNGLETNAWFEWGTDSTLNTSTSTSSQAIGSGTTSVPVNTTLTGLATGTTFYYRVAASNSSGTTKGSILSFVPGAAPAVTTLAATPVAATTATLNGNATANGLATDAWFEWGTDSNLVSSTSTSSQSVGSGTTSQSVSAPLTGLSTGTTYYYRVVASNSSGTSKGIIVSFTVMAPPLAPTNVGATPSSYTLWPNPTQYFMNVRWSNNSSNQDGVAIEIGTYSSCTNFTELGRVGPGVTSYSHQIGHGYSACYRVRAFNAAGYSPYSANANGILP